MNFCRGRWTNWNNTEEEEIRERERDGEREKDGECVCVGGREKFEKTRRETTYRGVFLCVCVLKRV